MDEVTRRANARRRIANRQQLVRRLLRLARLIVGLLEVTGKSLSSIVVVLTDFIVYWLLEA